MSRRLVMTVLFVSAGHALAPGPVRGASTLDELRRLAGVPEAAVSIPGPNPSASRGALEAVELETVQRKMLSGMSPARADRLRRLVSTHIVARRRRFVDEVVSVLTAQLPPTLVPTHVEAFLRSYRERAIEPGDRTSAEPRGYTHVFYENGAPTRIFCFVGAENLGSAGDWDDLGSRMRRLPVHELAHATFATLSASERAELRDLCVRYRRDDPDPANAYRDGDENEFFAVVSEIWFDVHQLAPFKLGWDTREPFVKLAGTMRFLEKVYGPPHDVRP